MSYTFAQALAAADDPMYVAEAHHRDILHQVGSSAVSFAPGEQCYELAAAELRDRCWMAAPRVLGGVKVRFEVAS